MGTAVLRTLAAGSGISLTYSGTDSEIVISATDSTYRVMAISSQIFSTITYTNVITELAVAPIIMNNSFIPSEWLVAGAIFEFYVSGIMQFDTTTQPMYLRLRATGSLGTVPLFTSQFNPSVANAYCFDCTFTMQVIGFNSGSGNLTLSIVNKSLFGLTSVVVANAVSNIASSAPISITLAAPYTQLPWFLTADPGANAQVRYTRNILTAKQIA